MQPPSHQPGQTLQLILAFSKCGPSSAGVGRRNVPESHCHCVLARLDRDGCEQGTWGWVCGQVVLQLEHLPVKFTDWISNLRTAKWDLTQKCNH